MKKRQLEHMYVSDWGKTKRHMFRYWTRPNEIMKDKKRLSRLYGKAFRSYRRALFYDVKATGRLPF